MARTSIIGLAAVALALVTPGAAGAEILDPAGDFLATYTGPQNGDLDLLSVDADYLGDSVRLSAMVNGSVGGTTGAFSHGASTAAQARSGRWPRRPRSARASCTTLSSCCGRT